MLRRADFCSRPVALAVATACASLWLANALVTSWYFVDVLRLDAWEAVALVEHSMAGTLRMPEMWGPHNEHRPLTGRLIALAAAHFAHWNHWWEFASLQVVAALQVVVVAAVRHRAARDLARAAIRAGGERRADLRHVTLGELAARVQRARAVGRAWPECRAARAVSTVAGLDVDGPGDGRGDRRGAFVRGGIAGVADRRPRDRPAAAGRLASPRRRVAVGRSHRCRALSSGSARTSGCRRQRGTSRAR